MNGVSRAAFRGSGQHTNIGPEISPPFVRLGSIPRGLHGLGCVGLDLSYKKGLRRAVPALFGAMKAANTTTAPTPPWVHGSPHYSLDIRDFLHQSEQRISDADQKAIVLFRGMCDFYGEQAFFKTLESFGCRPVTFRYPPAYERLILRTWQVNAAYTIQMLCKTLPNNPNLFGHRPVFMGHSAGGYTVRMLGAIQRGGNLKGVLHFLRQHHIENISQNDLERLRDTLKETDPIYIANASPLKGVELVLPDDAVKFLESCVGPGVGGSISHLTRGHILPTFEGFESIARRDLDATIVAVTGDEKKAAHAIHRMRSSSRPDDVLSSKIMGSQREAIDHAVHGVIRGLGRFIDIDVGDLLVSWETAFVEGLLTYVLTKANHLDPWRTSGAAEAVWELIQIIESRRGVRSSGIFSRVRGEEVRGYDTIKNVPKHDRLPDVG